MLTVIARLKVAAGQENAFHAAAEEMIAHVQANEPGTLVYRLLRSAADPTEFVFYERYADQAAFATHGGSAAMQKFFQTTAALFAGRPEIAMYEDLGGKS